MTTDGRIVDAHDGNVVRRGDTYYMFGEYFGDGNFVVANNTRHPKLAVYTSKDLLLWEFRGLLHNNSGREHWAASGHWPDFPAGAWYSPSAVWSEVRQKFVLWWTASPAECCSAKWGVAESSDGVHFDLISLNRTASIQTSLDGSALLVDDDGRGYVAYSAMNASGMRDHTVFIDRLAPDLLSSAGEAVARFPDSFVEGAMLFKRRGRYYVLYGSCCCACKQGSGVVVHSAPSIRGPWTRQAADLNCKLGVPICAGMAARPSLHRPQGGLLVAAQGIGLSVLPLASNESAYIWHGQRWLSAPHAPPRCTSLCHAARGECAQPADFAPGRDFDYWKLLEFDEYGRIRPFGQFVDEFKLDLR